MVHIRLTLYVVEFNVILLSLTLQTYMSTFSQTLDECLLAYICYMYEIFLAHTERTSVNKASGDLHKKRHVC